MEVSLEDKSVGQWYHFLTAAVAPRPIAWVTTLHEDGSVNAAPFSWFQSVSTKPPRFMVAFADARDGGEKDTLRNAKRTNQCTIHIVPPSLGQTMVNTSAPREGSETEALGIQTEPFESGARISAAPVAFSCKVESVQRFSGEGATTVLILQATKMWVDPAALDANGNYDGLLLARMGGKKYTTTKEQLHLDVEVKE